MLKENIRDKVKDTIPLNVFQEDRVKILIKTQNEVKELAVLGIHYFRLARTLLPTYIPCILDLIFIFAIGEEDTGGLVFVMT